MTAAVLDRPEMTDLPARRRLRLHYYAAMLSAAAVAAALGMATAYAGGHFESLAHLLAQIALWLVVVNLAGAVVIFRPIDRYLRGEEPSVRPELERRIRTLPRMSGLWLFGLALAAMLGHATMSGSLGDAAAGEQRRVLAATLVHIGVFAAYLGLAGYFLIFDYRGRLLGHLWQHGVSIPPGRGKFMHRLIAGLVAVAVAPVLIPLSDRWVQPRVAEMPMRMAMGSGPGPHFGHMRQTLQMDLLAALFLAALLMFLMARGFTRPVGVLLEAMQRVDRGDLGSKAPVVSDDEFGRLAQQFNRMVDGLKERDRIRRVFGRFVPESVAAGLIVDEGAIAPREREATVLFTDIENFTSIAAQLDPREILDMLNAYFGEIAAIVHARAGVITQFQGDAVLASFNLPVADPEHARHAVEAALTIQQRLGRAVFGAGIRLRTRAGISTGAVVGGTVGGGERLGYTVHGDTVNLAARFEALNKELGTRVLLCARTAELLGDAIALHDRGMVSVRGFGAPLRVFEPLAVREGTRADRV